MRYIGVIIVQLGCLCAIVLFGYRLYSYYFEDGSYLNLNTKVIKSQFVGRIEAQGEDPRVYEFRPQGDSKKLCVVYSGTNKASMQCWDK